MSKTIVIYKTKYGSAKKYAHWISQSLGADLFDVKDVSVQMLNSYDTIIYGGGLYAGGLLGFSFIKKNYELIKNKNVVVFAVGSSLNPDKTEEEIKNRNLSDEMKEKVKVFFLRGALDYKKMKPFDKFLMFCLKKTIEMKKTEDWDDDTKGIIATYGKSVDFTDEKSINPILQYINSL